MIGRAIGERSLFVQNEQRQRFVDMLVMTAHRRSWQLYAYTLMSSHYHLVVRTLTPTLSAGIQWIHGVHSQRYNRCMGRFGPLWAGRFKSFPIEDEGYRNQACYYTLYNPVRAGLCNDPLAYRWSGGIALRILAGGDLTEDEAGAFSCAYPFACRIEKWLPGDLAVDPLTEDLDGHSRADCRLGNRQVGIGDRLADRVAIPATRHATHETLSHPHGLRPERDRTGIGKRQAAETPLRVHPLNECVAADERTLLELDRELEAGLERGLLRGDIRAPHPVSFLQTQRVDRLVSGRDEAVALPRLPECVPKPLTELGGAVELPPELSDVCDAECNAGDHADRELPRRHIGESVVREVVRGQRLQDLTARGPQSPKQACADVTSAT